MASDEDWEADNCDNEESSATKRNGDELDYSFSEDDGKHRLRLQRTRGHRGAGNVAPAGHPVMVTGNSTGVELIERAKWAVHSAEGAE